MIFYTHYMLKQVIASELQLLEKLRQRIEAEPVGRSSPWTRGFRRRMKRCILERIMEKIR